MFTNIYMLDHFLVFKFKMILNCTHVQALIQVLVKLVRRPSSVHLHGARVGIIHHVVLDDIVTSTTDVHVHVIL